MHQLDSETSECTEATTVTVEWTVRDLKQLFDTSKGESKSKVVKSALFGGGKWQCLFYPNSGTDGGVYVSLYLSCEPTIEEKENALNGKWSREGVFKFSFELRDVAKNITFNSRDANNHSFSYKTSNWGWAQFARRDTVYYHALSVKYADAFKIICSITSGPTDPTSSPIVPFQSVPQVLVDTIGNLLDDPLYSDVEFVFPVKSRSKRKKSRTIWANRALLRRADYFRTMFEAGFAETTDDSETQSPTMNVTSRTVTPSERSMSLPDICEDSDEEDEVNAEEDEVLDQDRELHIRERDLLFREKEDDEKDDQDAETITDRNGQFMNNEPVESRKVRGPKKTRIVIKDFAYATYRAVLYYLYTDSIVFAPLSSSFLPSSYDTVAPSSVPSTTSSQITLSLNSGDQSTGGLAKDSKELFHDNKATQEKSTNVEKGPTSRKEWLREWRYSKPNRVSPCSAKAVYRLADKLDLKELKERAFQHIIKSLTVTNVAYEVFSSFSSMFEDVRKVQVDYFLSHWSDIRGSDVMRTIWQQIRLGRYPGFEEVWPMIALNLEYTPHVEEKEKPGGKRHVFHCQGRVPRFTHHTHHKWSAAK